MSDDCDDVEDDGLLSDKVERLLCTTDVVNIHEEPTRVLDLLFASFTVMANSHRYYSCHSSCFIKFHKDISAVTFHPISCEDELASVNFGRYPRSNTKTLLALEDLGRGSTGKAWLCATVSKLSSAVCVLKFDNKQSFSGNLAHENAMWHLLYPEFDSMVRIKKWSGSDALVMPHFSTNLEGEREGYKHDDILELL